MKDVEKYILAKIANFYDKIIFLKVHGNKLFNGLLKIAYFKK